jgi:hypothetical protein
LISAIAAWISSAARTASTALANSATALSPALPNTRPRWRATSFSITARQAFSAASVASSSCDISRLKPTMSAARIAAIRRST